MNASEILSPQIEARPAALANSAQQLHEYLAESIAYSAYLACGADDEKLAFEDFLISSNRAMLGDA